MNDYMSSASINSTVASWGDVWRVPIEPHRRRICNVLNLKHLHRRHMRRCAQQVAALAVLPVKLRCGEKLKARRGPRMWCFLRRQSITARRCSRLPTSRTCKHPLRRKMFAAGRPAASGCSVQSTSDGRPYATYSPDDALRL